MLGRLASRSTRAAALTSSTPLISSVPTLRRPTVGLSMPNTMRAIAAPITARSTRCCASPPMVAPTSSTIDSPRKVGHIAAIAGRSIGRARLHRFDCLPHRRLPPPGAQRLARLVAHLDRDVGMKNARLGRELGVTLENRADRPLLAVEEKLEVRPALERDRRGGHDDGRPVIAAHRVQRYANIARHSLVRPPRACCSGGARRGPRQ